MQNLAAGGAQPSWCVYVCGWVGGVLVSSAREAEGRGLQIMLQVQGRKKLTLNKKSLSRSEPFGLATKRDLCAHEYMCVVLEMQSRALPHPF